MPRTRACDAGLRDRSDTEQGKPDDRPPICPACGVTMGIVLDERESPRFVCLECGFGEGE